MLSQKKLQQKRAKHKASRKNKKYNDQKIMKYVTKAIVETAHSTTKITESDSDTMIV